MNRLQVIDNCSNCQYFTDIAWPYLYSCVLFEDRELVATPNGSSDLFIPIPKHCPLEKTDKKLTDLFKAHIEASNKIPEQNH